MSSPPAQSAAPSSAGSTPRPWLHVVYYVLAIVDIVAVCISLFLINLTVGIHETSVQRNVELSEWSKRYATLALLAGDVNAPGNDVFADDRIDRVIHQRRELSEARTAMTAAMSDARLALPTIGNAEIEREMADTLDRVDESIALVVGQAGTVFDILEAPADPADEGARESRAAIEMAAMDRHFARVYAHLLDFQDAVNRAQDINQQSQLEEAKRIRQGELLVGVLIAIMIGCVVVFGHILTKRMRAYARSVEDLVERRTAQLEATHTQLRLSERLASIGTLAAGLGHDMNNVLFPVRCRLDAIEAEPIDDAVRTEVGAIRGSVDYLQQLCDGLRLLALDPEDPDAASASTALAPWWAEVSPLFRTALPKRARLEFDVPDDLPPVAVAPHRMTQAVLNLVVNSADAILHEGLIAVRAFRHGDHVRVEVRDDGAGMSEAVRRQALDPFFTTKRRSLSTGLGLALVHGVATAAGGRVEIESAPGAGCTVMLDLPVAADISAAAADDLRAVLSVTDPRVGTFFGALLGASGFDVDRAPNGVPGDADLWVVDGTDAVREAVREFLGVEASRHVIALGASAAAWNEARVVVVAPDAGIDVLQRAIRAVRDDSVRSDEERT